MSGPSEDTAGAGPSADEDNVRGVPPSERAANGALVGCLWIAGGGLVLALFYFGFFVFAVLDDQYGWGLLEPFLDERTSEVLYVIYWPLIHLYVWLSQ